MHLRKMRFTKDSCGMLYSLSSFYGPSTTNRYTDRSQAERALASNEVPVGCVFVHQGKVIGEGMNDTNSSLNVSKMLPASHPVL